MAFCLNLTKTCCSTARALLFMLKCPRHEVGTQWWVSSNLCYSSLPPRDEFRPSTSYNLRYARHGGAWVPNLICKLLALGILALAATAQISNLQRCTPTARLLNRMEHCWIIRWISWFTSWTACMDSTSWLFFCTCLDLKCVKSVKSFMCRDPNLVRKCGNVEIG